MEPPIAIRQFRDDDTEHVRRLFWLSNTGPNSPLDEGLRANLRQRTTVAPVILSMVSLYHAASYPQYRILGALVALLFISFIFLMRWFMRRAVHNFTEEAFATDMADIEEYYGIRDSRRMEAPGSDGAVVGSNFWVAETQNSQGKKEIVGYVGLDTKTQADPSVAELRRMGVSPNYRRKGIGAMLLQVVIAHAHRNHLKRIVLSTTELQKPAIAMYKKAGWVLTEVKTRRVLPIVLPDFKIYYLGLEVEGTKEP